MAPRAEAERRRDAEVLAPVLQALDRRHGAGNFTLADVLDTARAAGRPMGVARARAALWAHRRIADFDPVPGMEIKDPRPSDATVCAPVPAYPLLG